MAKLLIVDDEMPSRELVKMNFDWNSIGFDTILEAKNGHDALDIYYKNDIELIISDIRMPVMDGIEFLRNVFSSNPSQKVLVLSCHEDFSFVKQTLKMGAKDYILKDSLTEEVLHKALTGIINNKTGSMEIYYNNILYLALNKSDYSIDLKNLDKNDAMHDKVFCIVTVRTSNQNHPDDDIFHSLKKLYAMLKEYDVIDIYISSNTIYILSSICKTYSKTDMHKNYLYNTSHIYEMLKSLFGDNITAGVSDIFDNPNNTRDFISQAEKVLKCSIFNGINRIHYFKNNNQKYLNYICDINIEIENLKVNLKNPDKNKVYKSLDLLYNDYLYNSNDFDALQHTNALLMTILTQECTEKNLSFEKIFNTNMISLNILDGLQTVTEICDWYKKHFEALINAMVKTHSPRIQKVVDYIDKSYKIELSLEDVADTFHMHKVYLAKIFKAEMNMSVNEYIRFVRMEYAKKLLQNKNAYVNEIVDALGFHSSQTFYNLFKKHTGMSPSQYKKQYEMNLISQFINKQEETVND